MSKLTKRFVDSVVVGNRDVVLWDDEAASLRPACERRNDIHRSIQKFGWAHSTPVDWANESFGISERAQTQIL
jgi:hypothetical protein